MTAKENSVLGKLIDKAVLIIFQNQKVYRATQEKRQSNQRIKVFTCSPNSKVVLH